MESRNFEKLGDAGRHNFVEIKRRIFVSPGVVIPVDDRQLWIDIAGQKNWAVIAAPRLVGRDLIISDAFLMRQRVEYRARFRFVRTVNNVNPDWFRFSQSTDHFEQSRQHAIE